MVNNKNSKIWGPFTWYAMHSIAYQQPQNNSSFPKEVKDHLHTFYTFLGDLLPCPICKKDYKRILLYRKIKHQNGNQISRWTFDVHNYVNSKLKKKMFPLQEAKKIYTNEIQHTKLQKFVYHILEISNTTNFQSRKKLIQSFVFLYPTSPVKTKLQEYLTKNPIHKVKVSKELTEYIQNMSKLITI